MKDLRILDFGAGFGSVADHLASNNNVIAFFR
jgi:2-polyprenyl-3-methyl-5-hydroxy-6-metoxy-1,4-benzoquinol methylase